MTGGLVTILIRSMGRLFLHMALDSVAVQEYPQIEVNVIAANGSAHERLSTQCGPFPLKLVGTGNPLSRAEAANVGLASANGDYCIFLDDDDFHDPDHVSGLMTTLDRNPQARVAYSGIRVIGADGAERGVIGRPYDRIELHERNYIQIGAALFDRRLADEGCRFDNRVGSYDDWDFWLQCSERTDFAYHGRPSTNWRSEIGESGAGGGPNFDPRVNASSLAAVHGKWEPVRERLRLRFQAHAASGQTADLRGDWPEAERCYLSALRIHGTDPDMLNHLGLLRLARGDSEGAFACLRLALRMHPERSDVAVNLARSEMEAGNPRAGRRLLELLLSREPDNTDARALLSRRII
ncbi:MAG: tetratricopeptide repeat protein [Betaproteobacteria bacterium]